METRPAFCFFAFMPAPQSIVTGACTIHIGEHALDKLAAFLKKKKYPKLFVLADENTVQHCLPRLIHLVPALAESEIIELESGEEHKTIETCTQVWRVLGELGADRHALLLNLGGGVITDMGGFIASTYKRGIDFVNLPTTLLAQIDASAGGKTGIDLDGLKNEIGLFADPAEVFIYPPFLQTLPGRQIMSGFAEALKHGLIADAAYWDALKQIHPGDYASWERIIQRSVEIKTNITEADPTEQGLRKTLNFGHTIGHAVETLFLENQQASLLHGEAVVVGMICETFLSKEHAGLDAETAASVCDFLLNRYGTVMLEADADHRLIELMRRDKKNAGNAIHFTLLKNIGEPVINIVCAADDVSAALAWYREKAATVIES